MSKMSCLKVLARPVRVLKKNGLLPVKQLTTFVILKFLSNVLFDITILSVVLQNVIIAIKAGNITLLNWMTCVLFPLTNYFAKTIPLWINNDFFSALDILNSRPFNLHNEELNRHIQTIDAVSKLILRYFMIAMTVFVLVTCLLPFFTRIPPMIPAPFNTGKYDNVYKLAHFLCSSYLAVNSTSIEVFYMTLIAICAAQLDILQEKLINMFEDAKVTHETDNKRSLDIVVEDILKECIILHQTIITFVKKLCSILAFPLFMQYVYGSFVICNTILQLTILGERNVSTVMGLCGYSSIVLAEMTVYHWLGNEVIYKSDKMIEACYLSNWHNLNLRCQRYLVILMERAKRPLTICLYNLVIVSLASLGSVVRGSYSVFALIKARYK